MLNAAGAKAKFECMHATTARAQLRASLSKMQKLHILAVLAILKDEQLKKSHVPRRSRDLQG